MSFEQLALHPQILRALAEAGYSAPSAIQQAAVPEAMAGADLMASAPTGTGKTAAFVLPTLHRLASQPAPAGHGPRALVLAPTRELATQVGNAVRAYGKHLRVRCAEVVGGMPYPPQTRALSRPLDILVATPGRLIDHMESGRLDFSRLQTMILDEADRMLDMGFVDDVQRIAAATPADRQTLLFSATLEGRVAGLARELLTEPKRIQVASVRERHENIEQRVHHADDVAHKHRLLDHLLQDATLVKGIIFTATKRDAEQLAGSLAEQGRRAAALHGDMSQRARNRTVDKLRSGAVRLLVATDVAARGLDVSDISHVLNFDLPRAAEDYVHRIGRTGRAGASGTAISFVLPREMRQLRQIEQYTGQRVAPEVIPGLEPRRRPRPQGGYEGRRTGKPRDGYAAARRQGEGRFNNKRRGV